MKNTYLLIWCFILSAFVSTAQVKIGNNPTTIDASSVLELESTTLGFLPPRMNTEQRNAIGTVAEGLVIYNLDINCLEWFNGSGWYNSCACGCPGSIDIPPGPLTDCSGSFVPPYIPGEQTVVRELVSNTGKIWMDRNLGAYTQARSTTDCYAYGNLYQWGRNNDGHESRFSTVVAGPVTSGNEGSNFISNNAIPFDWLTPQDATRWNANELSGGPAGAVVKTANDPCPDGFRIPTSAELADERAAFTTDNAAGAFESLKLTLGGARFDGTGNFYNVNVFGLYWSSTVADATDGNNDPAARRLQIGNNDTSLIITRRAHASSVRCIKE
ncbi:MAG: fibrobacter succinogenes major paralogous domain-containing protein [Oceanicaulis sp.]|nr:fibrobacter succinogenes major paralogous domain-containing protein [Oceanicaulis sp.]